MYRSVAKMCTRQTGAWMENGVNHKDREGIEKKGTGLRVGLLKADKRVAYYNREEVAEQEYSLFDCSGVG